MMGCKVKGMVCEVKDNFGNVEKDYMGWLEKAYNSFVYISSWKFNTTKAKKEIKNICDCMVELKDFIDKYELEHEIENLNKDSAQFDCEMYIKKNELEYIADEIRAAYKKGWRSCMDSKEKPEVKQ